MRTISLFALLMVFSIPYLIAQDITSYEGLLKYHEEHVAKVEYLQEKEIKTQEDRFQIIQLFDECSETYESLIQKDIWFRTDVLEILIDNYTYCMRKYPDKSDTSKILHYFHKAKIHGLCDYKYVGLIVDLRNSDIFRLIKHDPCIQKLLKRLEIEEGFWTNNYFSTPYYQNITDQEKIVGLSNLWAEVKFNFAYFDQIPGINWDSLYYAFIPKVLSTTNTIAYYDTLQVLCSKLRDSHTQVFYPNEANFGKPPIRSILIEDRVFINEIFNTDLIESGIENKMEILKINGLSLEEYARNYISRYIGSSTEQDLLIRTYNYNLFFGDRDESLLLELRDKNGILKEFEVRRNLPYDNYSQKKALEFEIQDDNIGYLILNSFSNNNRVTQDFDSIFEYLNSTNALIIDVRNNGGGTSEKASYIFSCFIDTLCARWKTETREYLPSQRAWSYSTSWHQYEITYVQPNTSYKYSKPVVILTSPKTFSAAEDFCMLFDMHERATIIGESTAGSKQAANVG